MEEQEALIYGLRTTANREDQVMDFVSSNAAKKKLAVFSIIRAHGMRGYIFLEAGSKADAEQAAFNVPYARGILSKEIDYKEIEHMLEQVKVEMNILKNDVVEIISGPFKREQAKVSRIDRTKEEVVVELLEAAVPIPITVKMDAVKVIRRESDGEEEENEEEVVPLAKPEERTSIPMPGSHTKVAEDKPEGRSSIPMPSSHTKSVEDKPEKESFVEKVKDVAEDVVEKVEEVAEDVAEALHLKKKEGEEAPKKKKEKEGPKEEEKAKEEKKEVPPPPAPEKKKEKSE